MPTRSQFLSRLARGSAIVFGLAFIFVLTTAALMVPAPFERLRMAFFDSLQRSFPWQTEAAPVTVVDIDEKGLARFGQWPWSRDILARLVTKLQTLEAASIAFDVVFAEPDRASPHRILADLEAPLRGGLPDFGAVPDYDAEFAQAIAQGGVTLGFGLLPQATGRFIKPKTAFAVVGGDIADNVAHFAGAVANLPALEQAAAGLGSFTVVAGHDEIVRRLPLLTMVEGQLVPSLALEALRVATGEDTLRVRLERSTPTSPVSGMTLRLGEADIPLDKDGALLLHHRPARQVARVSAADILGAPDAAARALIAGHVVFVGASAVGLNDLRPTPLSPFEPGVNIHANAAAQIALGHFLTRPATAAGAELLVAIAAGLLVLLALSLFGLMTGLILSFGLVAAAIGGSGMAFVTSNLLLDPTLPVLCVVGVFTLASLARHFLAERQGAALSRAFAQYLSPELVKELARNPELVRLGGEEREMSFVFTDLEGFTSLTETLAPERLVTTLNAYLDGLCRIATDHGGTIDKIVGDAVHVMFNAPLIQPDHAYRAVTAALAMRRFGDAFSVEQKKAGLAFGITRIGINTGLAIVGNFGGAARFDYTAHGDAINTAARLEAANKTLGSTILMSAATRNGALQIRARPLGALTLRGKSHAVEVFEPLETDDPAMAYLDRFIIFAAEARQGSVTAVDALAELARDHGEDKAMIAFLKRLAPGRAEAA